MASAREDYGVVINESDMTIDLEATKQLREKLSEGKEENNGNL
jgi:hypothetical protein